MCPVITCICDGPNHNHKLYLPRSKIQSCLLRHLYISLDPRFHPSCPTSTSKSSTLALKSIFSNSASPNLGVLRGPRVLRPPGRFSLNNLRSSVQWPHNHLCAVACNYCTNEHISSYYSSLQFSVEQPQSVFNVLQERRWSASDL